MPVNKPNGRKQEQHIKVMNAIGDVIYPSGEWRKKGGRPSAAANIREYRRQHPNATKAEVIRGTGLSKPTVYKYAVKVSGIVFIDEQGERLIKHGFSRDGPQAEVSGQTCRESPLYDILKAELQAKNEQIATLQSELSIERQHSREQAEKIAVLAGPSTAVAACTNEGQPGELAADQRRTAQ